MKMVVSPSKPAGQGLRWSPPAMLPPLRAAIHVGYARAIERGVPVLVSVSRPVTPVAPLRVLAAATLLGSAHSAYFAAPSEDRALVGIGHAAQITTTGPTRFTDAAIRWHEFMADAVVDGVVGPLFLGGFAFDPLRPHTDLWRGFSETLLAVPQLLWRVAAAEVTLTLSVLVAPAAEPTRTIAEASALLARFTQALNAAALPSPLPQDLHAQDVRPAREWRDLVATTADAIRAGRYQKVVLARGVEVTAPEPFEADAALEALTEHYPTAYQFALHHGDRTFMGATPELLARVTDGRLQTMALAGSAPRGATASDDDQIGAALLDSVKNQGEHHIVTSTIRAALAARVSNLTVDPEPHLRLLPNVQHLETRISGELLPGQPILDLIGELHPTPAVGGFPRDAALAAIRATEGLDRGWYAAPVGWIDADGNGEFAVALRSGIVRGDAATLFAGCGIVGDSDPDAEYHEAQLKLQPMLRALGGE
ncbi:MAG: isochorismate synthase [Ktedonobacterales bacterium]|nr:isochorismate synthase [Ktedonobacterales bacterium]